MDENDRLFGMLRRGPFGLPSGFDPGQTAYDAQPPGISPQGFIDELDTQFMTDFALYGVYNGAFGATPPLGLDTDIVAVSNELPGWPGGVTQVSGNAITAQVVADAASPSGHNLRFTIAAGAAGDEAYIGQIVPIGGSRGQAFGNTVRSYFYRVACSGGAPRAVFAVQYLTASRAPTGSSYESVKDLSADATLYLSWVPTDTIGSPPADAAYLRLRIGVRRNSMAASDTATLDLTDVRQDRGASSLVVGELSVPNTYNPGKIFQSDGVLAIMAAKSTLATTYLQIDAPNGDINLIAANDIVLDGDDVLLPEVAAPSTPASGYYAIYPKTDGILYGKNDAGTEVALGGGGPTVTVRTSGTANWTPAAASTVVRVLMWGAGGGGASGACGGNGQVRAGGGGGGGGAFAERTFKISDLTTPVSVAVGSGGTGGVKAGTAASDGNAGNAGGNTTFGSYATAYGGGAGRATANTIAAETGGSGGGSGGAGVIGATATTNTGGVPASVAGASGISGQGGGSNSASAGGAAEYGGGAGGGHTTAANGDQPGGTSLFGGGGGGAGGNGGLSQNAGADGGNAGTYDTAGGGGGGGGAVRTNGTAGASGAGKKGGTGGGGGGGSSSATVDGGDGGAGGAYGGGGGGGGAGTSGTSAFSGKGGTGGNGAAIIIEW